MRARLVRWLRRLEVYALHAHFDAFYLWIKTPEGSFASARARVVVAWWDLAHVALEVLRYEVEHVGRDKS